MVLAFFENERQQIKKVVDYAQNYIYQTDDLLDMKNGEMATPSEDPGHSVLVGIGRWIFGIESPLLDEYININKEDMVVNLVLPLVS